jgi:hypothetical protein
MLRRCVPVGGLFLLATLLPPDNAGGCMIVSRVGQKVEMAEEEAIIVWDASTKTQHFIRRAAFKTTAKDFGFLVPTPTRPTLAESDDKAFVRLAKLFTPPPPRFPPGSKFPGGIGGGGVVVVEKKRVAGLDAVVLQARDPAALNGWLKDHGYPSRPEQVEWLRPYVEKQWLLTAFKFAAGEDPKEVATRSVRMSFKTERPFFPYREPTTAPEKGTSRLLRVYLVGTGRATATRGEKEAWPPFHYLTGRKGAKIKLPRTGAVDVRQLTAARQAELLRLLGLPAATLPAGAYVTRFNDRSSPRLGTEEVYFTVAAPKPPAR